MKMNTAIYLNTKVRSAVSGVRRHPWRAALICIPLLAATVFTSSTMASATATPTLAVPASALNATPAPDILTFDNGMTGHVADLKKGAVEVKVPWNVDGCDHDYGAANQCIPWKIPAPAGQACTWLRSMGFGALKVNGTNRQNLPENAEGYVCA
jgi:hypothetical protein